MSELPKIIAVIGPTASGKTALGLRLALANHGEIVSADAKQVFRGMDIGTAKEKHLAVAQHLLDIRSPGERITVGEYQKLAFGVIDSLLEACKLPILVGGSGLYAESVLEGYQFAGPGQKKKKMRYQSLVLGIDIPRQTLKERARIRLDDRLASGMVEEVAGLLKSGVDPLWLERCGIEYRYISRYLRGSSTYLEMREAIATATDQFIKRQYTWWRRSKTVIWIQSDQQAETLVRAFLRQEGSDAL